ncbi:hypothetical protein CALCODRAFT_148402 [Calocera cornea HHB12733]|uniref:Uncharacterized protein n=1 Tax=Calocera cornea HHB12733 TaxID=1353952 RepID=A0A165CQA8_9BASI|nr:hypothetical protein CALCODRAFT_148402 [Calocera cornea HHB12733]
MAHQCLRAAAHPHPRLPPLARAPPHPCALLEPQRPPPARIGGGSRACRSWTLPAQRSARSSTSPSPLTAGVDPSRHLAAHHRARRSSSRANGGGKSLLRLGTAQVDPRPSPYAALLPGQR